VFLSLCYMGFGWALQLANRRLLGPIGFVPPAEYEARYYEQPPSPDSHNSLFHDPGAIQRRLLAEMRPWAEYILLFP
jgi:hypothetical protein